MSHQRQQKQRRVPTNGWGGSGYHEDDYSRDRRDQEGRLGRLHVHAEGLLKLAERERRGTQHARQGRVAGQHDAPLTTAGGPSTPSRQQTFPPKSFEDTRDLFGKLSAANKGGGGRCKWNGGCSTGNKTRPSTAVWFSREQ